MRWLGRLSFDGFGVGWITCAAFSLLASAAHRDVQLMISQRGVNVLGCASNAAHIV
jgi:hypothetical protein